MSEFEGEADVQQIRVIALVMITVLLGSARMRHSAQMRTVPYRAVAVDKNVIGYAFLRLVIATNSIRPEPKRLLASRNVSSRSPGMIPGTASAWFWRRVSR
jgi:hypothetical protein